MMGNVKFKVLITFLAVVFVVSIGYVVYLLLNGEEETTKVLSKNEQDALLMLLEGGDPSAYQSYLKDGRRLSFVYEDGETPLEKLIRNGDYTGALQMIETGFNLNEINDLDPINTLSGIIDYNQHRYIDQVNDILIKLIEQVNGQNKDPERELALLFSAIKADNYLIVEKVLESIRDINRPYEGHTALSYASLWGSSAAIFDVLIENGADLNRRIDIEQLQIEKLTPLMVYLIYQGDDEAVLVQFLTHSTFNPNLMDSKGNTILHYAVKYERLRAVRSILTHTDIDLTLRSQENLTALELAQQLASEDGDSSDFDEIVTEIQSYLV